MLQRLGIADALSRTPTSSSSTSRRRPSTRSASSEVLDLLRRLVRERGMAILLSSHLLNQVQSVCDRIGIFAPGRLIGQGTMAQLAERFGEGGSCSRSASTSTTDDDDRRVLESVLGGVTGVDLHRRRGSTRRSVDLDRRASVRDPAHVRSAVLAAVAAERPAADVDPCGRAIARGHLSTRGRATGRIARREPPAHVRGDARMTSTTTAVDPGAVPKQPASDDGDAGEAVAEASRGPAGRSSPAKEFGDHLLSARFLVLVDRPRPRGGDPAVFRQRPRSATRHPAPPTPRRIFIALFWLTPVGRTTRSTLPSVAGFLGLRRVRCSGWPSRSTPSTASGRTGRCRASCRSRSTATTSINGKFAAGLAVIAMVLVVMIGAIAAFGLIRLGIVPEADELLRIVLWMLLTFDLRRRCGWRSGCCCRWPSGGRRPRRWSVSARGCCSRSSAA